MKRIMTIITILAFVLISVVMFISIVFSEGGLFLKKELTSGFVLQKELLKNRYNLVSKKDRKVKVEGISSWIITDGFLVGRFKNKERYFLINKNSGDVEEFPDLLSISLKQKQLGLKIYDINDEESFVHLKYGKRKYPLKN